MPLAATSTTTCPSPPPVTGNTATTPRINTKFGSKTHPITFQILPGLEKYFTERWPFSSKKDMESFGRSNVGLFTCMTYIDARDDRIRVACLQTNSWFLINDMLDTFSFEKARAVYTRLASLITGDPSIAPSSVAEEMISELHAEIRSTGALGENVCKDVVEWIQWVSNKERTKWTKASLKDYLDARIWEVGYHMMISLLYWTMNRPRPAMPVISELDRLAGYHISLVNDLYSYHREVNRMSKGEVAAAIMNGVVVVMSEQGLGETEAIRWIERYIEELEDEFDKVVDGYDGEQVELVKEHATRLRYFMGGNALWSMICGRYQEM